MFRDRPDIPSGSLPLTPYPALRITAPACGRVYGAHAYAAPGHCTPYLAVPYTTASLGSEMGTKGPRRTPTRAGAGRVGGRAAAPGNTAVNVTRVTKAGRVRMQLLVDPALLAAAGEALGTRTKSDAVNTALRNAAENAAILRGIDASIGTIPDFPYVDT